MEQDEAIFQQYIFTPGSWTAPDGTWPLVPKDNGRGVMVSAFCCRELGFAPKLSDNQFQKINKYRCKKKYSDEDAAKKINGTPNKLPLNTSPFMIELEYGSNNEGYWNYDRMVLQIEDCTDCFQVLYPGYDILFLLDHSNGHDYQQQNGLNLNKIRKEFDGQQPKMQNTIPFSFGPHTPILKPGQIQSLVFLESDEGPFYLSASERQERKYDKSTGRKKSRELRKDELEVFLQKENIPTKGNKQRLQKLVTTMGYPTREDVEIIKEGWVGKPKGSFQILYERGFINPLHPAGWYTVLGRKDVYGNIIEGSSLKEMMASQQDFIQEKTLLQVHADQIGISILRTPKCHPELAGEGIEYRWGCAKGKY